MRKASTKDILRTIWKEKKRFISIMMITVLGVTLMTGLEAGCRDLKLSADQFYDSQKLFDVSIMSTLGLTEDDVLAIQRMEGVEKAEGTFSEIVHTKKGDVNKTAEIKIVRENGLNVPYVLEGRLPMDAIEIVVSENYLKETGKHLGETLTIEEIAKDDTEDDLEKSPQEEDSQNDLADVEDDEEESQTEEELSLDVDGEVKLEETETPNFPNTEFTIVGTVIDVMDINNAEGSAGFRATPNADYTFFVTPDAVESDVYTAVYLTMEGTRELLCYSPEYEEEVAAVTQWIENEIMEQRQMARYQQITGEAYEKIAEKEAEMEDAFADIEKEFSDAEEEIADARKEIDDGWKELEDARKKLEDGRLDLIEGRQELDDGWKELEDGKKELEDARKELEDSKKELEDGKHKLAKAEKEAKEEIANARKELEDAHVKLSDAWEQLNQAEKQINIGQAQLEEGKEELTEKEKEAKAELAKAEKMLDEKLDENNTMAAGLEMSIARMKELFGDSWEEKMNIDIVPPYAPQEIQEYTSLDETWDEYVTATAEVVSSVIVKQMNAKNPMSESQLKDEMAEEISEALGENSGVNDYAVITAVLNALLANYVPIVQNTIEVQIENESAPPASLTREEVMLILGGRLASGTLSEAEILRTNLQLMLLNCRFITDAYGTRFDVSEILSLATGIATCKATEGVLAGAVTEFEAKKKDALSQIRAGWAELHQAESELEAGRAQLSAGREEVSANYQKWKDGVKELEESEQEALREIADKWAEIAEGEQELLDGEQKLLEGQQELLDGEQELIKGEQELIDGANDLAQGEKDLAEGLIELEDGEQELLEGQQELEDHRKEYLEERAKAEDKIAEAKQKVADIDMTKWYVQDRTSLSGYANVDTDTACIESLATVFTIVFFIVAILISLTTVTRMVEEERGLIGTYKALGFTDGEIRRKYVIYSMGASFLGTIIGDVGGFVVLPEILFVFFKVMYLFPDYSLQFEIVSGTFSGVLFIIGIVGAALVACYSELKHVPAHLMRPKAPKEGSRVFLEYIKPLWKRMSFLNKVTARNLFRYKKRMFMTLFGIMGCTALLVFGLAIKDSVAELMHLQYETVYDYDLLAATTADDNEKLITYVEESSEVADYLNIQVESVKLKNGNKDSEKVQLIVFPDKADVSGYFSLTNDKLEPITIGNKGIYLTENASRILDLKVGDTAFIQKLDLTQEAVVITSLVKNYLGNSIYMSKTAYEEIFGVYEPNGILADLSDSCPDQIGFSNKLAEEEWILSSVSTQELVGTFSQAFTLINIVVYVVLVLAACLAFVVLFTLASINISERERELATIKVLGFYDKEVHAYVNKETLILTSIGILIGLPVGAALSSMLTDILNMPSIYFAVTIYERSYWIAAGIALGFAFIVQFLTDRSLDVINPVEALKSVE